MKQILLGEQRAVLFFLELANARLNRGLCLNHDQRTSEKRALVSLPGSSAVSPLVNTAESSRNLGSRKSTTLDPHTFAEITQTETVLIFQRIYRDDYAGFSSEELEWYASGKLTEVEAKFEEENVVCSY